MPRFRMHNALTSVRAAASFFSEHAAAKLATGGNETHVTMANDHLTIALAKSNGHIVDLVPDGQNFLGVPQRALR
jgi:reverse gyrase